MEKKKPEFVDMTLAEARLHYETHGQLLYDQTDWTRRVVVPPKEAEEANGKVEYVMWASVLSMLAQPAATQPTKESQVVTSASLQTVINYVRNSTAGASQAPKKPKRPRYVPNDPFATAIQTQKESVPCWMGLTPLPATEETIPFTGPTRTIHTVPTPPTASRFDQKTSSIKVDRVVPLATAPAPWSIWSS